MHKDAVLIDGLKITNIHSVCTQGKGELQFFEVRKDIPFEIKRFYYITGVNKGVERGGHAHKSLKQLIFCPYGEIDINFTDIRNTCKITLDNPYKGILIEKPIWREMIWKTDNAVLCVAASEYYNEEDYIRDFSEYSRIMEI